MIIDDFFEDIDLKVDDNGNIEIYIDDAPNDWIIDNFNGIVSDMIKKP